MKKEILLVIVAFIIALTINAQQKDHCGSIKEISKNQITIPYAKDGVCIQFFYSKTGKFSHSEPDFVPPTFLSQVVYDSWKELVSDFPASSKDSALIKFNWNKLSQFGKHQNWETIVKNSEGKIYIGNWLDMSRNHDAKNIKIVDITTSCFHPSCQPNELVFTIGVYLAEK
jgi:hypothetical protein